MPTPQPRQSSRLHKQDQHNAHNIEAAEIILDNVETNGGEQSALVQWARLVTKSGKSTDFPREAELVADSEAAGQSTNADRWA